MEIDNITSVEIEGSDPIIFDFSMSTILKFVQSKKWTYGWEKCLGMLLGECPWTEQMEFLRLAHTVACTRRSVKAQDEATIANHFVAAFAAFAKTLTASFTSEANALNAETEKKI